VHNRFATAPEKKGKQMLPFFVSQNWSGRRVSNSRPQPWQGCALPTELLPQYSRRFIAISKNAIVDQKIRTPPFGSRQLTSQVMAQHLAESTFSQECWGF
jgi:hypothetical protein